MSSLGAPARRCINFPHELTCQSLTNQNIKSGRRAWSKRDSEKSQKRLPSLHVLKSRLNFRVRGQFEIKILQCKSAAHELVCYTAVFSVVTQRSSLRDIVKFWFRTDLGRENSTGFLTHAGKAITFDFSHCHALITLYVQFLCSDWSKIDRWVHAENLCSVWKIAYW